MGAPYGVCAGHGASGRREHHCRRADRRHADRGPLPDLKFVATREPNTPLEVRKLVITPGSTAVPDIAAASTHYPLYALTSRISNGAGAIFGVNGDFGTPFRQPVHNLMIDGELWTTGENRGHAVAWNEDGQTAYLGALWMLNNLPATKSCAPAGPANAGEVCTMSRRHHIRGRSGIRTHG